MNNLKLITDKFGDDFRKTNGDEITYNCPFCLRRRGKPDNDRKLYVNIKSLKFHCFKCGAKGRLGNKLKQSSSGIYKDIINYITGSDDESDDEDDNNVFYVKNVPIRDGTVAYEYCVNRGITREMIDFYNIRMGVDDLFGRIVIPNEIYGDSGIWTDMFQARSYIGQNPKYKNPVGAKKTHSVFNLHNIKEGCDDIYVCEGAITAICAGRDAVGVYGCHPSEIQIKNIVSKNPKNIYCVLDNDEAGREPNKELADIFRSKLKDSNVYLVFMPEGTDAADYGEVKFKKYVLENRIPYLSRVYVNLWTFMNEKKENKEMLNIPYDQLLNKASEEINEAGARQADKSPYPLVYPGENGKLTVRILYNEKMVGIQRRIVRHDTGSRNKVACMKVFGEDCPVCAAISEAETVKGKDCGAFAKYGYKIRGLCFAKIIDHDSNYFKGDDDPKKGDIIRLMYPKSVYDAMNNIINDSGENLNKIIGMNDGIPFVINRTQKGGGFPKYEVSLYPYGTIKAYDTEEEFEDMIHSLPDLSEEVVPVHPNDDIRKANKALAEAITQEYIYGNVVNPGDDIKPEEKNEEPKVENAATMVGASSNSASNPAPTNNNGLPDCFGHHEDNSSKCLLCPKEIECFTADQ